MVAVIAVDPFKPRRIRVKLMKRRLAPVNMVEVFHPLLDACMIGKLQDVPLKLWS